MEKNKQPRSESFQLGFGGPDDTETPSEVFQPEEKFVDDHFMWHSAEALLEELEARKAEAALKAMGVDFPPPSELSPDVTPSAPRMQPDEPAEQSHNDVGAVAPSTIDTSSDEYAVSKTEPVLTAHEDIPEIDHLPEVDAPSVLSQVDTPVEVVSNASDDVPILSSAIGPINNRTDEIVAPPTLPETLPQEDSHEPGLEQIAEIAPMAGAAIIQKPVIPSNSLNEAARATEEEFNEMMRTPAVLKGPREADRGWMVKGALGAGVALVLGALFFGVTQRRPEPLASNAPAPVQETPLPGTQTSLVADDRPEFKEVTAAAAVQETPETETQQPVVPEVPALEADTVKALIFAADLRNSPTEEAFSAALARMKDPSVSRQTLSGKVQRSNELAAAPNFGKIAEIRVAMMNDLAMDLPSITSGELSMTVPQNIGFVSFSLENVPTSLQNLRSDSLPEVAMVPPEMTPGLAAKLKAREEEQNSKLVALITNVSALVDEGVRANSTALAGSEPLAANVEIAALTVGPRSEEGPQRIRLEQSQVTSDIFPVQLVPPPYVALKAVVKPEVASAPKPSNVDVAEPKVVQPERDDAQTTLTSILAPEPFTPVETPTGQAAEVDVANLDTTKIDAQIDAGPKADVPLLNTEQVEVAALVETQGDAAEPEDVTTSDDEILVFGALPNEPSTTGVAAPNTRGPERTALSSNNLVAQATWRTDLKIMETNIAEGGPMALILSKPEGATDEWPEEGAILVSVNDMPVTNSADLLKVLMEDNPSPEGFITARIGVKDSADAPLRSFEADLPVSRYFVLENGYEIEVQKQARKWVTRVAVVGDVVDDGLQVGDILSRDFLIKSKLNTIDAFEKFIISADQTNASFAEFAVVRDGSLANGIMPFIQPDQISAQ